MIAGQLGDVLLELRHMADRGLHAGLDRLAQRPIFFAAPCPPGVIGAVEFQEHVVTPVTEVREKSEILGDRVEHVAMQDKIAAAQTFVDMILDDLKVLKVERQERGEHVVVVAADIHHLGIALFEHLEDDADESRVSLGPVAGPPQLPAVDDIAVENELLTADVAEKMVHLARLAVGRAEMHVGDDHRAGVKVFLSGTGIENEARFHAAVMAAVAAARASRCAAMTRLASGRASGASASRHWRQTAPWLAKVCRSAAMEASGVSTRTPA